MSIKPLEKKFVDVVTLSVKAVESKSALDPSLIVKGKFTSYKPLPNLARSEQNNAAYEECQARLALLATDLKWLLGLPHGRFWCQVIYDDRLHQCLDTYLRYSPRSYDNNENLRSDDELRALHSDVHRLVFLTCVRMANHREGKDNFLSPPAFADIIYENFLFDIPMIMDLCLLYGRSNGPTLTKMITNIFTRQPKYNHDLDGALMSIKRVFDTIAAQCDVSDDDVELPPKLDWAKSGSFTSQPDRVVSDIVDYLFDVCQSLTAFTDVYRPALKTCYTHHVFNKISWFYHNVIPVLKAAVLERDFCTLDATSDIKSRVRDRLSKTRSLLVKLVRQIVNEGTIEPILTGCATSRDVSENVEAYLQTVTSMLNDKKFMRDYEARYPFADDVEILGQTNYKIDETRIEYIRDAITAPDSAKSKKSKSRTNLKFRMTAEEEKKMRKRTVLKPKPRAEDDRSPSPRDGVMTNGLDYAGIDMNGAVGGAAASWHDLESMGACAPAVEGVELESLITAVHDILPDLGYGFIERCLDEYNYDQSAVINALLTDSLRPNVRHLDRSLKRSQSKPKPANDKAVRGAKLLKERRNVFDGDEMDVFSHPELVDVGRMTRGKKHMGEESTSMVLDDHREVERYREIFDKYTTIDQFGEPMLPREYDAMYDDEYDDTYDTTDVGAMLDADEIEENFKIQPLNEKKGPRRFHNPQEEDVDQEQPNGRNREMFLRDPAVLREERERRRASQRGGGSGAPAPPKKHDVVGKAKGQGQEKSVLKNRDYKDKNKARMGNHNRRAMADKKKAKGMF